MENSEFIAAVQINLLLEYSRHFRCSVELGKVGRKEP